MVNKIATNLRISRFMLYWWNHLTSPVVNIIALIEPVSGQGLLDGRGAVCEVMSLVNFSSVQSA